MKIKVNKEAIIDGLQKVQSVINPRNALPVLANVLFKAEKGKLELTATDMSLTVRATLPADVLEPGATTLPAPNSAVLCGATSAGSRQDSAKTSRAISNHDVTGPSFVRL